MESAIGISVTSNEKPNTTIVGFKPYTFKKSRSEISGRPELS